MTQTFKAIYENGILRPLQPLARIPENRQVDVTVTVDESPERMKQCFGSLDDADAKEMTAIIESEFEKVDPDDWK